MKIHSSLLLAGNCIYLVNSLVTVPSDLEEFVLLITWCFGHLCFQQLASRKLEIAKYKQ